MNLTNRRTLAGSFAILALTIGSMQAAFAGTSPVGRWQTIDDATGKPKSIVEITDSNGELTGKVVKLLNPSRPNPTCDKCDGERKGKPVEGMTILWGAKSAGDSWEGGQILDPEKGKIYSLKLTPEAGSQKLQVRGFLGFSMLGRTQEWVKAP